MKAHSLGFSHGLSLSLAVCWCISDCFSCLLLVLICVALYLAVVQFRLELLVVENLASSLHKVFLQNVVTVGPNGKQTGFGTDVAHIGTVETIRELHDALKVNLTALRDARCMDLENLQPLTLVGFRDFNLTVQPSWTEQGRVQNIRPVRGHDHLDLALFFEAVHLVEQFHERTLNLTIGRCTLREPRATDGINLVHENDARLVVPSETKHLTDNPGRLSDVLINNGRRHDL